MANNSNQLDGFREPNGDRRPLIGVAVVALLFTAVLIYLIALFVADSIDESKWTWWLFSHEFNEPSAWYEVARSTVAFTASLGIGLGLVIAYRRQDVSEKRERFDSANEEYRRASELYDSAVSQLGHESSTVRLAAMYTLDRLGSAHPEFRQNVVDVWCAYLRVGVRAQRPPGTQLPKWLFDAEQEVRLAAQRLLASHLRMTSSLSWVGSPVAPARIDVDLRGAALSDFDCADAAFSGGARFDEASFSGIAQFDGATFSEAANFKSTSFSDVAHFDDAKFEGPGLFDGATFSSDAEFNKANFSKVAFFRKAHFLNAAGFREAVFADTVGAASFSDAVFGEEASFEKANFRGRAVFSRARFSDLAIFEEAVFSSRTFFSETEFSTAVFIEARFGALTRFNAAIFSEEASFVEAKFGARAEFNKANFSDVAFFGGAEFSAEASFAWARFGGHAEFNGAKFYAEASFAETIFSNQVLLSGTTFAGDVPAELCKFLDSKTNDVDDSPHTEADIPEDST